MHFNVYSKYFYSKLTAQEKLAYDKIAQGWLNYNGRISVSGSTVERSFDKIVNAIWMDLPELFYVNKHRVMLTGIMGVGTVTAAFLYSEKESEQYKAQIKTIVDQLPVRRLSVGDRLRYLYDYLTKNVTYAQNMSAPEAHSVIGPFIKKNAVCEGYAYAFKLLCDAFSIPNIIVSGTGMNPDGIYESHSWNIVRINGVNYQVDPTWDSLAVKNGGELMYYCVSDAYMRRDHRWEEQKWPDCGTKGEIERTTVFVSGPKMFYETLEKSAARREKLLRVAFSKTFASSDEIMKLLSDTIKKLPESNIASYYCQFSGQNDCVVITLTYR